MFNAHVSMDCHTRRHLPRLFAMPTSSCKGRPVTTYRYVHASANRIQGACIELRLRGFQATTDINLGGSRLEVTSDLSEERVDAAVYALVTDALKMPDA